MQIYCVTVVIPGTMERLHVWGMIRLGRKVRKMRHQSPCWIFSGVEIQRTITHKPALGSTSINSLLNKFISSLRPKCPSFDAEIPLPWVLTSALFSVRASA